MFIWFSQVLFGDANVQSARVHRLGSLFQSLCSLDRYCARVCSFSMLFSRRICSFGSSSNKILLKDVAYQRRFCKNARKEPASTRPSPSKTLCNNKGSLQ